jgi:hypothetical protein
MAQRSSFWGSFWRETGKNTGKWASNKVFGSGWSTPFRHIVESDKTRSSDFNIDYNIEKLLEDGNEKKSSRPVNSDEFMLNAANQVVFNQNDVTDIRTKLDELLVGANMARDKDRDTRIFEVKIKSGIVLLKQQGGNDIASFYESELKNIRNRRLFYPIKMILMFVMGYVILFVWWKAVVWLFK